MALFNYTTKEITLKIVYYGPGFSGKTTNLQYLHSVLPADTRGKLISMATEGDRTIFFDFLPVEVGKISEFNIRFQLYTVPGQVRYNATRRLVLKGADAVVFVADSQKSMKEQNIESLVNMKENLEANNLPLDIPKVFQYNKRDIDNVMSIEELNKDLNSEGAPYFEAIAVEGKGVEKTFLRVAKDALEYIKKKHNVDITVPETSFIISGQMPKAAPGKKPAEVLTETPVEMAEVATTIEEVKRPAQPKQPAQEEEEIVTFPRAKAPQPQPSAPQPQPSAPQPAQMVKPDLTEIVESINGLKDVLTEVNRSLKGIQINQSKNIDAINDLRRLFEDMRKEKRGFRLFR